MITLKRELELLELVELALDNEEEELVDLEELELAELVELALEIEEEIAVEDEVKIGAVDVVGIEVESPNRS